MAGLDLEGEIDLEQLGLPISNTENKLLETEVQRKEKDLAAHQVKISQHKERIQAVGDHLRNVKQELQHTQVLLCALVFHKKICSKFMELGPKGL